MNQIIHTANAPAAIGPYSQAIKAGNLLFLSGALGMDPATGNLVGEDVASQAAQAIKNIDAILKEAGYGPEDVVKTTCFLADIADFAAFNAVYGEYFISKPARSCFAVKDLPKAAKVEIEVVASK